MKQLGYYAKDSKNNLHQFEWGKSDEFYIIDKNNVKQLADSKDYEILEIGVFESVATKKVCCPKCNGGNVRSIDNQPLYHPTKNDVINNDAIHYDSEVYMKFICDDDNEEFTKVFNLI